MPCVSGRPGEEQSLWHVSKRLLQSKVYSPRKGETNNCESHSQSQKPTKTWRSHCKVKDHFLSSICIPAITALQWNGLQWITDEWQDVDSIWEGEFRGTQNKSGRGLRQGEWGGAAWRLQQQCWKNWSPLSLTHSDTSKHRRIPSQINTDSHTTPQGYLIPFVLPKTDCPGSNHHHHNNNNKKRNLRMQKDNQTQIQSAEINGAWQADFDTVAVNSIKQEI